MNKYLIHCECNSVQISLIGQPKVHAYCHCIDCRGLLDAPYHAAAVWLENNVSIDKGKESISIYQHPVKHMKRCFCKLCGETLFNTNCVDWRVVSQLLIAKCNENILPEELSSDKHIFYEQRVVDVNDDLPKYLRGTSGPLCEEEG